MAQWIAVCRTDEIPDGRGCSLDAAGMRLALFRTSGGVVALAGRCPHSGGSLGHGWLDDGEVVCPLHQWRFKLADGRCSTMPGEGVHRFRCELRGDDVWVEI
jgi:nitrite reductase/ring-hydroxylating ferredoxin subunit